MPLPEPLSILQSQLDAMPPVAALQVRVLDYDGRRLRLTAPLAANVNDKGCAFGGSLSGLMTLSGWGLINLRLAEAGHAAEVFVADSQVRYLAPLYEDLVAEATLGAATDWTALLAQFAARGKLRAAVEAAVRDRDGRVVATLEGRYAAFRPAAAAVGGEPCIMPA